MLGAEGLGITLTEHFAMYPTASVSGEYFVHPQSRYFGVEKVGRDQVEDYAARKGVSVETVEQFIPSNLNYKGM
jgi:5-methyltetrahydrofolate--homocysteine methyltransferase